MLIAFMPSPSAHFTVSLPLREDAQALSVTLLSVPRPDHSTIDSWIYPAYELHSSYSEPSDLATDLQFWTSHLSPSATAH